MIVYSFRKSVFDNWYNNCCGFTGDFIVSILFYCLENEGTTFKTQSRYLELLITTIIQ